ncbi:MAG: DUF2279 domain-containing protein [Bacteroidota bacterium]|nr:DUF2279 domain-containing protein [Bacteroidota bacterium]
MAAMAVIQKKTFLFLRFKQWALLLAFAIISHFTSAQAIDDTSHPGVFAEKHRAIDTSAKLVTPKSNRVFTVSAAHIGFWTGTFISLNKTWYSQYPRSSFHFFNDNDEWEQMDKLGHMWTAYNLGAVSAASWRWAGLSERKSVLLGGISAIAYQSIIEIQDGFSAEWGFSWGDMTANALGAAAFAAQQLHWKEQRIQLKLSYWGFQYAPELISRRNDLFGTSLPERMLKDYNSQTYWFSANIHSFFPQSKWPAWLNLSVGYGADGMLGGTQNTWTDKQGIFHDRRDIPRMRRFFIAPDIDLTKIKTKSKILRTVFSAVNVLKFPAPALEVNGQGKWVFHALYY